MSFFFLSWPISDHPLIAMQNGDSSATKLKTGLDKWDWLWDCVDSRDIVDQVSTLRCNRSTIAFSWLSLPLYRCNTLQYTAIHCNTLQHTATHCITLQHSAIHCNTLQHTATHCDTLQHTATHCNTGYYGSSLDAAIGV